MVGLMPKTLLDFVESSAGAERACEVRRLAGISDDRRFRIDEVYDDDEWRRMLDAARVVLDVSQADAERAFADFFFEDALRRWPMWFRMSGTAREFLERQPRIHNGFATGVASPSDREAINDKFTLEQNPGELIMHYRSPNQLCGLYMALARWIINHYGDEATIEETSCLKQGANECEIHIRWACGGGDA